MPYAKKSLGQHFLRSTGAVRALVLAGHIAPNDTVVEIGPGKGVLTKALLDAGARVIAIEKDHDLIPFLEEKFASEITSGKLILIEDDVLTFDPAGHGLTTATYKLIANIPYYITGAIIEHFLANKTYPEQMVLLVQKEVAQRIVARDGKESILSLSVKIFGVPKIIQVVKKEAFSPAPKVDSAIIAITEISRDAIPTELSMRMFFRVVKAGFAHKRKLLARNLEEIASKEVIRRAYAELGIADTARAETLSSTVWQKLAKHLG